MNFQVQKHPIHHKNLVGTLYTTVSLEKKPGLLLISGSDGGIPGTNSIPETFIEYLVRNGFVIFSLAYFGINELPKNLENITLEYFTDAIEWFITQPQVNSHIGIIGQSRGAELSLLLGSYFPKLFQAIVAISPCNMVCGGFPYPNRPTWKYKNKPIPYLSGFSNSDYDLTEATDINIAIANNVIAYHANNENDPYVLTDLFLAREENSQEKHAEIAIENIQCPILLLSGDKDDIWPSEYYCQQIKKRWNHHSTVLLKHINYRNAGHGILASYDGAIYHPIGHFWCKLGGTQEGNKNANQKSWVDIKQFLLNALYTESDS